MSTITERVDNIIAQRKSRLTTIELAEANTEKCLESIKRLETLQSQIEIGKESGALAEFLEKNPELKTAVKNISVNTYLNLYTEYTRQLQKLKKRFSSTEINFYPKQLGYDLHPAGSQT